MDPTAVIRSLWGVNIALELDRFDAVIERAARARYIRPEYRSLAAPSQKNPTEGAFLARAGVLVAIKSVIVASDQTRQPVPFDPLAVGDVSLDANEIAFASPTGRQSTLDDFDIVVHFIAAWDLYNPRFLGYSLARAYRMIELFQGNDPIVVKITVGYGLGSGLRRAAADPFCVRRIWPVCTRPRTC